MPGSTVYVFYFTDENNLERIPYTKWNRIRSGNESIKDINKRSIFIAYAYLLLEDRKPNYCPRIDGAIYYFDENGRVISDRPHYYDLLQDLDESAGGAINLQHRKKKMEESIKYRWQLNAKQIQLVIDSIW